MDEPVRTKVEDGVEAHFAAVFAALAVVATPGSHRLDLQMPSCGPCGPC